MLSAKEMQIAREAANLQNHKDRIRWLTQENPKWACGTPVDVHSRNVLLLQSQDALKVKK